MTVRVLVADDHSIVREGLRALLEGMDGFEIVGAVATGEEAVRETVQLRPDLVVMDIAMPGLSGVEATRRLQRAAPATKVLTLTMFDDDDAVLAAVRAGSLGYILKGADPEDLQQAMRSVAAGQAVFGQGLARRVLDLLTAPRVEGPPLPELTVRERQVLDLMAAGLGNASIAHRLGISPNTVANHASNVLPKLRVGTRAEAIQHAREAGLGTDNNQARPNPANPGTATPP